MPKKLLRRFIPSHETIKKHPSLSFLGPLLDDPNLFHLNRYSVSMAFLVGVFCAFLPIPGQMIVAALFALIVRSNLPLSIALVFITNPLTMGPIYFMTYKLGNWLLDTPTVIFAFQLSWEWVLSEVNKIWKPLIVGSLCAGSFFAILSYSIVKVCWRLHVIQKWQQRVKKRSNTE